MNHQDSSQENNLHSLRERAKELNCLYQVDELLSNMRLSLPEIFSALVQVIPAGWQYPELCEARIIYDNRSYQTTGFCSSPFMESVPIKVDDTEVGRLDVVYTQEVPPSEEGFFLEKEHKLVRTIADRIGQTIWQRRIKEVLLDWEQSKNQNGQRETVQDWVVIVDLLRRTDPDMLMHLCRRMINHLLGSGVKEADDLLQDYSPGWKKALDNSHDNYPSARVPLGNLINISDKVFQVASRYLTAQEISLRLQKWMQERKAYGLVKTIGRVDASVAEIIEALVRYQTMAGSTDLLPYPTRRWLQVALIKRFLSDNLNFIGTARRYVDIDDFFNLINRLIYPVDSHGKIGGKGTGLFLAHQIIRRESQEKRLLADIKVPRTWYITTDELTEFLHYNDLQDLNEQKYKDLSQIRMDYPNIIQRMKNCRFPPELVKSLALALDDFGTSPIIVRSSSLLEDQAGASFSGKYKSLFLANQGSKEQRLEALLNAVVEVYASVFSPDSIQYRAERNLLDFQEEMGILIQEVVGKRIGHYYVPLFAGVAFSRNEYRWSPRIRREEGLIRMVMGLGTRAVDRVNDDFPVLISPGQPGLRVNRMPDEIKHYAPKKMDVINLESNTFETIEIESFLRQYGSQIPSIHQLVGVKKEDFVAQCSYWEIDFEHDDLVVTFDGLIDKSTFVKKVDLLLKTLEARLGYPVDIEFASDGQHFYLLQCRPQGYAGEVTPAAIPQDIPNKDIIFSAQRQTSNGTIGNISYIVYVDPAGYASLENRDDLVKTGRAIGLLNALLPRKGFVLMGPGRWGSRGDIRLGVPVSYADICNTAALIEIARRHSHYQPELSFGTHFFQDLVESGIRYLPLYPDDQGIIFNDTFLRRSPSLLTQLLPEYADLEDVIRVIDVAAVSQGRALHIAMNADLEQAIGYLSPYSQRTHIPVNQPVFTPPTSSSSAAKPVDDTFWRWRYYMAERIAEHLDFGRYGVKGVYLIGSTNNGTAGPGSDIDLLIHIQGSPQQRQELDQWLKGWSQSLAESNYLKTGYRSEGLLDIHYITDQDIEDKTSFAIKIGAITDPAYPLKIS